MYIIDFIWRYKFVLVVVVVIFVLFERGEILFLKYVFEIIIFVVRVGFILSFVLIFISVIFIVLFDV